MKVSILVVASLACLFGIAVWPFFYNAHVSPLGRLHKTVAVGDPWETTASRFQVYYDHHRDAGEISFNEGTTETDFASFPIEPSRFLAPVSCQRV